MITAVINNYYATQPLSDNPFGMDSLRMMHGMTRTAVVPLLVFMFAIGSLAARKDWKGTRTYKSPDKNLLAVVDAVRNPTMHVATESILSIHEINGSYLQSHDFSSQWGDQGYVADGVKWTPDSQYCVFRMRNFGGRSSMFAPIVFWSRKANQFYSLKNYTANRIFSVAAPNTVRASTWPDMRSSTLFLGNLKADEVTDLH